MISAETDAEIREIVDLVFAKAVPYLKKELSSLEISEGPIELLYVPIVMRDTVGFPARSRLIVERRCYECCPQLNYQPFQRFDLQAAVREYVTALHEVTPHLEVLGASPSEIMVFENMLNNADSALFPVISE